MKKLFIALAAVALAACAKNDDVQVSPTHTFSFTADAPVADDASRAGYNSTVGAYWDANDGVTVYLGNDSADRNVAFSSEVAQGAKTATFTGTHTMSGDLSKTIVAVYKPANKAIASGGTAFIQLPSVQTYIEGGYTGIPLVGTATTYTQDGNNYSISGAAFKNFFSILHLRLNGTTKKVTSIVLQDVRHKNSTSELTGKLYDIRIAGVTKDNGDDTAMAEINKTGTNVKGWNATPTVATITLECPNVPLKNSEVTDFYIAVPSKNLPARDEEKDADSNREALKFFEEGVKITINFINDSNETSNITYTTKSLADLEENTIYHAPVLTL